MKDLFLKYKFHMKKCPENKNGIVFLTSPLTSLYKIEEY